MIKKSALLVAMTFLAAGCVSNGNTANQAQQITKIPAVEISASSDAVKNTIISEMIGNNFTLEKDEPRKITMVRKVTDLNRLMLMGLKGIHSEANKEDLVEFVVLNNGNKVNASAMFYLRLTNPYGRTEMVDMTSGPSNAEAAKSMQEFLDGIKRLTEKRK